MENKRQNTEGPQEDSSIPQWLSQISCNPVIPMFSFLASYSPRYYQSGRISPPFCLKNPESRDSNTGNPGSRKTHWGPLRQASPKSRSPSLFPFLPIPDSPRSPTVPDPLPLSTPITQAKGGMLKRTKSKLLLVTHIKP